MRPLPFCQPDLGTHAQYPEVSGLRYVWTGLHTSGPGKNGKWVW